MAGAVRENRFKNLKDQIEEARSDAALLRAGHMRLLQTLSERDQAVHEKTLAEDRAVSNADQNRIMCAAMVLKFGVVEFSDAEQKEAYRHADQVQILPDKETGSTQFSLLEGIALRELPKPPAAVPPPTDTPDTPAAEGTEEASDEAPALRAVEDLDENKEPLPS